MSLTFLDRMLTHAVYFERYKTHEVDQLIKVIDAANTSCKELIEKTNGAATKARYAEIMRAITKIKDEAIEVIDGQLKLDLGELVKSELESTASMLKSVGVDLELVMPAPEKVYAAATFMPFAGSVTFEKMLNDLGDGVYDTWDMAVRTGYLTGQTAREINRSVLGSLKDLLPGTMQRIRNSLERNTRTMLSHYAEQARNALYRANEDLFFGYRRLETLDGRTCLECGIQDGKVYKTLDEAPSLPAHYNCRGLYLPLIRGIDNYEGERASKDGPVPAKTTWEEWLKSQPEALQKDILGPSRYQLFKNGAPLGGFVPDGRKLSLEQWRAIEGNNAFIPKIEKPSLTESEITSRGSKILARSRENKTGIFEELRKEREFGSTAAHSFVKGSSLEAKAMIKAAQEFYPREWVNESITRSIDSPIKAKKTARAYFRNGTIPEISVSASPTSALHEMGHRFESRIPDIVRLEKEFFDRRTDGQKSIKLRQLTGNRGYRPDEVTKPDKFLNPYIGKHYTGDKYFEILSMGVERLAGAKYNQGVDDDFDSFIIGLLAGV